MQVTRRKALLNGGAMLAVSQLFIDPSVGKTQSGDVEITTEATIPSETSISVTIHEDKDGDGNSENSYQLDLSDGKNTYQIPNLESQEGSIWVIWADISMNTQNSDKTPELHSLTMTIPEQTDNRGMIKLFNSPIFQSHDFVLMSSVGIGGLIALVGGSLTLVALAAFLIFIHIGMYSGIAIYENIVFVAIITVLTLLGLRLWDYATEEGG